MVAVIDAPDAEDIERLPYIAGRAFFAGMRGEEKARVMRAAENGLELARRVAGFR